MNPTPLGPHDTLLAAIASCANAFRLLELLMRFCRDEAAAFRQWYEKLTHQNELPGAIAEARRVVKGFGGMVFTEQDSPDTLDRIRSAVGEYIRKDDPPSVVRSELLLRVMEQELGFKLRSMYPDFHSGPLQPRQLFPVYWPDL